MKMFRFAAIKMLERFGRQCFIGIAVADAGLIDAEHLGRIAIDEAQVVRNKYHGNAEQVFEAMDQLIDLFFAALVDRRRRFVENEHIWFAEESECNESALELAAGKMADRCFENVIVKTDGF